LKVGKTNTPRRVWQSKKKKGHRDKRLSEFRKTISKKEEKEGGISFDGGKKGKVKLNAGKTKGNERKIWSTGHFFG